MGQDLAGRVAGTGAAGMAVAGEEEDLEVPEAAEASGAAEVRGLALAAAAGEADRLGHLVQSLFLGKGCCPCRWKAEEEHLMDRRVEEGQACPAGARLHEQPRADDGGGEVLLHTWPWCVSQIQG